MNVPGFDLFDDPRWCPPERNFLTEFYNKAKGQDWINATGWVNEFNNHCKWHGVECNKEDQVINLMLNNDGLSGQISDAIGNLKGLEKLDLHDNDLKGSIPSAVGNLLNLSSLIVSFNDLTGEIPAGFASLSKLELLHIHANRLQGTVPFLVLKGHNDSSFIADCGSPSDFDTPLDCPSCTMCCNANHECDATESQTPFGKIS
eukprot:15326913-Ditylum_brightwellii.AAC.1